MPRTEQGKFYVSGIPANEANCYIADDLNKEVIGKTQLHMAAQLILSKRKTLIPPGKHVK